MIKRLYIVLVSFFIIACGEQKKEKLTIAAAANMQFAIHSLTHNFTKQTGIECNVILGSSGKLTAQILQGAPYDIFMSADTQYPSTLHQKGFTLQKPKTYAFGNLILWSLTDNITPSILNLTHPDIKHIALANPTTAPYGKASLEVLEQYNLNHKLQAKLIYGESISQVNQFVTSKATEIGFTSKSALYGNLKNKGNWIDIPYSLYTPIKQGIVILKNNKHLSSANQFYRFVFSQKGQQILYEHGYLKVSK